MLYWFHRDIQNKTPNGFLIFNSTTFFNYLPVINKLECFNCYQYP